MSKIIFNEIQMQLLENTPNLDHISERSISYYPDFKVKAVEVNLAGKGHSQVFIEHEIDLDMIGSDGPGKCLKRWRKTLKN